ncbi:MAG: DUF86 domain-containing protein [Chloroflexota bacterium]
MPRKDWTIRLEDMLDAAEKIVRYTEEIPDLDAFISNDLIVDGVIRNVQIIGEAARHIPDDAQARYPDVDWIGMRGMRNILVHDYAAVRLDLVWGVVEARIPPLVRRLREIVELEVGSELDGPGARDDAF